MIRVLNKLLRINITIIDNDQSQYQKKCKKNVKRVLDTIVQQI